MIKRIRAWLVASKPAAPRPFVQTLVSAEEYRRQQELQHRILPLDHRGSMLSWNGE